jgi:hypothetical protein
LMQQDEETRLKHGPVNGSSALISIASKEAKPSSTR